MPKLIKARYIAIAAVIAWLIFLDHAEPGWMDVGLHLSGAIASFFAGIEVRGYFRGDMSRERQEICEALRPSAEVEGKGDENS